VQDGDGTKLRARAVGVNGLAMTLLFNKGSERNKRRSLRSNMPKAEALVWARLRDRQVEGLKFRRQYSVGAFVLDFYCPELKLAVEIDGLSHRRDGAPEYDADRQLFLEGTGISVVRVTNERVYQNLDAAIRVIVDAIGCLRLRQDV
jgi:very-short-patch-repair endonuclease